MAQDLSKFREKWLKELQQLRNNEKGGSSSKSGDGASESGSTAKSTNATDAVCVRAHGQNAVDDDEIKVQVQGDQRLHVNARNHVEEHHQNESSATYYPFRILSTLLNRASSEEGPKRIMRYRSSGKLSDNNSQSKSVTPKRTYFSVGDSDTDSPTVPASLESATLKKHKVKHSDHEEEKEKKGYLDIFIADLDEISEIPFFDVSLPREVAVKIFQHLDMADLCRCAQVSKSWRSLAEDELLWCRICHDLGFEKDTLTIEHDNWKSRVRHYTIIKRTLELNWRNRTGKLHNLHHAKGGVLCAAHSLNTIVVAGYSNCQTKLWDVMSGETCVFQASSTALIINEDADEGMISNDVLHVATCDKVTAASYSHGFVDVWSNEEGTQPLYTFQCPGRSFFLRQPTSLGLMETEHAVYLAASHGHFVQVHKLMDGEGQLKDTVEFDCGIKSSTWLQPPDKVVVPHLTPTLIIATNRAANVMTVHERDAGCSYGMVELHDVVDAPLTCVDARLDPAEAVVGYTLVLGPSQLFRVNIYDLATQQTKHMLAGHTSDVVCVNMAESPPHQLVTGSRDRKVRVYDTRFPPFSVVTLIGHTGVVTTVQMDDGKVVSGDEAGFVCVWDLRMASKLWEMNNRHPVRYCHFSDRQLVVGHVPYVKHYSNLYEYDSGLHQRNRGSLHVYDFLADQTRQGVPEICLSSYDVPQGYNYNINLAVPYDQL